jgi:hypothetical protein
LKTNSEFRWCSDPINRLCINSAKWILDSGASKHFTGEIRDFALYEKVHQVGIIHVHAALIVINIQGKGAVFIKHQVKIQGKLKTRIMQLYPVFYIPKIDH